MMGTLAHPSSAALLPDPQEKDHFLSEIRILEGYAQEREFDYLEKHTKQLLLEFFGATLAHHQFCLDAEHLPIVQAVFPTEAPGLLQVALLCEGTYFTNGAGRHMIDLFSQWLIPGNPLPVPSIQGVNFVFSAHPENKLFFCHILISLESEHDRVRSQEGIHDLLAAIRKNITAVAYVRKLLAKSHLSSAQQVSLFSSHLTSLTSRSDLDFDQTLFEHASELFRHAFAEKKIEEARLNLERYLKNRRAFFDRDIFSEIHYFTWLYKTRFIGKRDRALVTKLIGLQYLFRKFLKQKITESPSARHVALKIFPLRHSEKTSSLGLLIGINLIKECEIFEERHALKAIEQLLPDIHLVPGSFIQDGRDMQKIRLFYLEFEKGNGEPFSSRELFLLRRQLSKEVKVCVETLIHPLFMPRNDEDLLRFSLQLCGQLTDPSAHPQMAIFFGNQTAEALSFTVILARIVKKGLPSSLIKELEDSGAFFEVGDVEVRKPPSHEKEWEREVVSFTAKLPKDPFLRADFTIDVLQARQEIVRQMHEALGLVRDYNGGLLETQLRAEHLFLASLGELGKRDTLLAKAFFHAITPPLMQIILETALLKKIYTMLREASQDTLPSLYSASTKRYELILIKSFFHSLKKEIKQILQELAIPSSQITYAEVAHGEECFFALIHQNEGQSHSHLISRLRTLIECPS